MPVRFSVRTSPIHGRGVFAAVGLAANLRLLEYRGQRISVAEADLRYRDTVLAGHTYLVTLNQRYLIDGNSDGNSARWFNHSCAPNCVAQVHVNIDYLEHKDKVWISTLRAIAAGEELTFDYDIQIRGRHTLKLRQIWACRCGAPECTGSMLKAKARALR